MLHLFENLQGLLKTPYVVTDGPVFRLHYRVTVLILLSASILLSMREMFGDPIHCIQKDVQRIDAVETFCWIQATFTLPDAWNLTVGLQVPHPGIDGHVAGQNKVYHGYYQWVGLVFFLQAVLFYLPRYMWKRWENGMMSVLCRRDYTALKRQTSRDSHTSQVEYYDLLSHFLHMNWGNNKGYFRKYLFCEFLTLVNVFGQMWLMDKFLGGVFTSFGIDVIRWSEWSQEYRTDPLVKAFPRVTKCTFYEFGSSGDVQRVDALCLLPLNILNEKICILLWFWLVLLCVVTTILIFSRLLQAALPSLRYYVLASKALHADKDDVDRLVKLAELSDWFILHLISKNITAKQFSAIVSRLAFAIEQTKYVPQEGCAKDTTQLKTSYV